MSSTNFFYVNAMTVAVDIWTIVDCQQTKLSHESELVSGHDS